MEVRSEEVKRCGGAVVWEMLETERNDRTRLLTINVVTFDVFNSSARFKCFLVHITPTISKKSTCLHFVLKKCEESSRSNEKNITFLGYYLEFYYLRMV